MFTLNEIEEGIEYLELLDVADENLDAGELVLVLEIE